ncbi:MAG TPA: DUF2179 domain-containing protein [Bacillota bacterium]|nr:DUF2179 domain-containing protein [Bacillota bacterium]HOL12555.1 DUF2179 domain-containing protein [Bacillota bacterium]HPP60272.1 DUF2179 domain-containing protein [Bacillota bacterium]HPV13462.1 DUF2179 domain-containing protein [Bacillota bacterium]HPZ77852.1 DUF2179 domain-containing protein [Bacillota bacterium]
MFLEYILIFAARVCDVSLSTLRMIMVVRGKKYPAAAIGMVEATIYIAALGRVMTNINDPWKMLAYGLGFATGTLLGSTIEERLAMGHVSLEVIPPEETAEELLKALRTAGYGVTVLTGYGLKGEKMVLMISTDRKSLPRLTEIIEEFAPDSFVTILETRAVRGGVTPYRHTK